MYVYVICILYNMARRDKKCFKKFFFSVSLQKHSMSQGKLVFKNQNIDNPQHLRIFVFSFFRVFSNARVRGLIKVSDLKSYNITQTVWFQQINNRVQSKISLAEEQISFFLQCLAALHQISLPSNFVSNIIIVKSNIFLKLYIIMKNKKKRSINYYNDRNSLYSGDNGQVFFRVGQQKISIILMLI